MFIEKSNELLNSSIQLSFSFLFKCFSNIVYFYCFGKYDKYDMQLN